MFTSQLTQWLYDASNTRPLRVILGPLRVILALCMDHLPDTVGKALRYLAPRELQLQEESDLERRVRPESSWLSTDQATTDTEEEDTDPQDTGEEDTDPQDTEKGDTDPQPELQVQARVEVCRNCGYEMVSYHKIHPKTCCCHPGMSLRQVTVTSCCC